MPTLPTLPTYASLITTAAKKTAVLASIASTLNDLDYEFEGKRRAFDRMLETKVKAESDISASIAQISALDTAIAAVPPGEIQDGLMWDKIQAVRKKENAERTLASVNEAKILSSYRELEGMFTEYTNTASSQTDIGGLAI